MMDDNAVTRAAGLLCSYIVECNDAMSAADTLTELLSHIFKDSPTAQNHQCGRTNATAIVKLILYILS